MLAVRLTQPLHVVAVVLAGHRAPSSTWATSRSSSGVPAGPPASGTIADLARPSPCAAAGSRPAPGSRCRSSGRASSSARRTGSTTWPPPATGRPPRPSRRSARPARGRSSRRPSGSRAPGRTAGRAATAIFGQLGRGPSRRRPGCRPSFGPLTATSTGVGEPKLITSLTMSAGSNEPSSRRPAHRRSRASLRAAIAELAAASRSRS